MASSAVTYIRTYKTPAERERLAAAFGSNRATAALFGPAPHVETVAGFTVFKSIMTLMILGALWGLLTSTRLLRGEEDAGRWDVMLSGLTTREGATVQAVAGMGGGAITLWLITAAFTAWCRPVLVGRYRPPVRSVLRNGGGRHRGHVLGCRVTHQPTGRHPPPSRQLCRVDPRFVARIEDGCRRGRRPARSHLGLAARMGRAAPTAHVTRTAGVVTCGCIHPRRHRPRRQPCGPAGMSVLASSPTRTHAPARTKLLFGQVGLTIRLLRPNVLAWVVALAATGFILGLVAKGAGATISGSSVNSVFTALVAPRAPESEPTWACRS